MMNEMPCLVPNFSYGITHTHATCEHIPYSRYRKHLYIGKIKFDVSSKQEHAAGVPNFSFVNKTRCMV